NKCQKVKTHLGRITPSPPADRASPAVVASLVASKTLRDSSASDMLTAQFPGQCPSYIAGPGALHKLAEKEDHPFRGIASGPGDAQQGRGIFAIGDQRPGNLQFYAGSQPSGATTA